MLHHNNRRGSARAVCRLSRASPLEGAIGKWMGAGLLINMTKQQQQQQWMEQRRGGGGGGGGSDPPCYLRTHRDHHHLDAHARGWRGVYADPDPAPSPRPGLGGHRSPPRASGATMDTTTTTTTTIPPRDDRMVSGSPYPALRTREEEQMGRTYVELDVEKDPCGGGGRKKNYQRYPKPPYSYLAMIAMVIQNSPEKKLTLSEILKEISTLFPFFKGNYKGWRDSVRHNLSSHDCFVKVLKDPGKPKGKGNFWAVELSHVPLELLKRQNTAVSRQDETIFAQDLAPYILHGHIHKPADEPPPPPRDVVASIPSLPASSSSSSYPSPLREDLYRPKLDSSFAIDSLLHSLRPTSAGEVDRPHVGDCWGEAKQQHPHPHLRPSPPPPRPRYTSSVRSASASSASPASSLSEEDWRTPSARGGKRVSTDGEAGSDDGKPPQHKSARRDGAAAPWELPTSYAKYTPPNAVAPPSMRFNGGPLIPLHGGLPLYGYGGSPVGPGHFLGHTYWPILPSGCISIQPPPIIMDLDSMLQSVPPNKSVFDVLAPSGQSSHSHPPTHAGSVHATERTSPQQGLLSKENNNRLVDSVMTHPRLQGHRGLGPQVEDSAVCSVELIQPRSTALSPL
ncbi:Forkhead box protein H1 [Merluccius polli]|uniref:Forkhead box protein H1 n=1 Tax=Merluccius polli TaxID=89951 RepID=A0AA47N8P6_MERPO|nr:Forkhead box protein H1 [Merluccius polli]